LPALPRPSDADGVNLQLPTGRWSRRGLAVAAGLACCFAMPPWGWWPLAIVGVALWALLLEDRTWRARFWVGVLVGLGWYLPSTLWMVKFSPVGWPVGVAIWFPFVFGVLSAMCPPGLTALALPGAVVLGEWFRWHAPFGGVPLSMLAYSQGRGPLLPVARLVGTLGVSGAVALAGGALAALARPSSRRGGAIALVALVVLALGGAVSPTGHRVRTIEAATVQGGGPQETRASAAEIGPVLDRHLTEALKVRTPVDLVVLPENIVNVSGRYAGSPEAQRVAGVAESLDATVVAGVVEDRGDREHFWNFAVAITPKGRIEDRYDKVRRVPYGEYVPMRNLLEPLAEGVLPPRDDREGSGPAVLDTGVGKLGVVISWETFFPRRVREAVHHDAEIILNPTNGSSYWLTQVQTQQIASSTLRAVESGRWVLQAAPTGFSAIIDPAGVVRQRSGVGEPHVLQQRVEMRSGRTLAMVWGEAPALVAAAAALLCAWLLQRRRAEQNVTKSTGGGMAPPDQGDYLASTEPLDGRLVTPTHHRLDTDH
jgi:apolipoprotein N-acyltransferase